MTKRKRPAWAGRSIVVQKTGSELVPVRRNGRIALAEIGLGGLGRGLRHMRRCRFATHGRRGELIRIGLVDGEDVHDPVELAGLRLGLFDGGIGLFHQGRIVLGHLVHGADRDVDLFDSRGLFAAFPRNAFHELVIGARRLHTVLERVLDEISFSASDRNGESFRITGDYVREKVARMAGDKDLSKYIL